MAVCPGCRGRLSAVYGRARKESDPNRGLVRFFFEPSCLLAVASRLPSLVEGVWDNTAGLLTVRIYHSTTTLHPCPQVL